MEIVNLAITLTLLSSPEMVGGEYYFHTIVAGLTLLVVGALSDDNKRNS